MNENITINVIDTNCDTNINIAEIMTMVNEKCEIQKNDLENEENYPEDDMEKYMDLEIDYTFNYTKVQLEHISKYYEISIRKKRKEEIIQDLIIFEINPQNLEIVSRRKYMWKCVTDINKDSYLSKYLNITT
tara:strand:- start:3159 stop:3554 length:396 start_codon:yes stop_codon:yes gene_type:complete